jgi:hypothetical protein
LTSAFGIGKVEIIKNHIPASKRSALPVFPRLVMKKTNVTISIKNNIGTGMIIKERKSRIDYDL